MHSTLCYTILFIKKQNLRIIRHIWDKISCSQPFRDLFTCVKTNYDITGKKYKNKGVTISLDNNWVLGHVYIFELDRMKANQCK